MGLVASALHKLPGVVSETAEAAVSSVVPGGTFLEGAEAIRSKFDERRALQAKEKRQELTEMIHRGTCTESGMVWRLKKILYDDLSLIKSSMSMSLNPFRWFFGRKRNTLEAINNAEELAQMPGASNIAIVATQNLVEMEKEHIWRKQNLFKKIFYPSAIVNDPTVRKFSEAIKLWLSKIPATNNGKYWLRNIMGTIYRLPSRVAGPLIAAANAKIQRALRHKTMQFSF